MRTYQEMVAALAVEIFGPEKIALPGCGVLAGKSNGKTARRKKLLAMSPEQRKAHRKAWREEQGR